MDYPVLHLAFSDDFTKNLLKSWYLTPGSLRSARIEELGHIAKNCLLLPIPPKADPNPSAKEKVRKEYQKKTVAAVNPKTMEKKNPEALSVSPGPGLPPAPPLPTPAPLKETPLSAPPSPLPPSSQVSGSPTPLPKPHPPLSLPLQTPSLFYLPIYHQKSLPTPPSQLS
ncbi:unnamed protein product [Microthlaspi erraticum]|uniref:Uncharacterized protein n=1 Tax=Microthlaspi erraticum TaxID=1685480 RepID=A0A6D2HXS3_9BRAS|nr:unnamed protein product [Microthlaspi erraticum]